MSASPDDMLLLNAYFDGELDAEGSRKIEERLEADPEFAAELETIKALRSAIAAADGAATLPRNIRARIMARASPRFAALKRAATIAPPMAAAIAAAALTFALVGTRPAGEALAVRLIADHQRAVLAASPVDFAASDLHAVKPWAVARLGVSPEAPDLSTEGFALVGARVSVVADAPSATVVYRSGAHLFSVFAVEGSARTGAMRKRAGFALATWRQGDLDYWVVSDASPNTMSQFVAAFRAGV
jgi:anti-sigma factor RsiW